MERTSRRILLLPGLMCLLGYTVQLFAGVDTQTISVSGAPMVVNPSSSFSFDVNYDSTDPNLTGVSVQLYFDSSKLNFDGATMVFMTGFIGQQVLPDTWNDDSDANTDMFFNIAYTDVIGNWPGSVPQKLYTANFTASGGFSGSTTLNFTGHSAARFQLILPQPITMRTPATTTPTGTPTITSMPTITPTTTPTRAITPTPSDLYEIPTLSERGMALMILLLVGIASLYLIRSRS